MAESSAMAVLCLYLGVAVAIRNKPYHGYKHKTTHTQRHEGRRVLLGKKALTEVVGISRVIRSNMIIVHCVYV